MQAPSRGLLDDSCVSPQERSTTIWSEPLPDGSSTQGPLGVDSGCSGHSAIAAAMSACGIRTARGGAWHSSTVRNLLVREVVE
jgi:hypothetical protein